eukprot:336195_1
MKKKTQVINNQIDPKWNESIIIKDIMALYDENNEKNPLEKTRKIICEIFHHAYDSLQKDKVLGRFVEDVSNIFINDEDCKSYEKPVPMCYQTQDAHGKNAPGQVLVAFEFFKSRNSPIVKLPSKLTPNLVSKWMHIIIFGLRDLQSRSGLLHNPFIEFEINGIICKTKSSNLPTTRNPNFSQLLSFSVELPDSKNDDIFLPNLNLVIKDSLYGGIHEKTIGCASIMLQDLLFDIQQEKSEDEEEDKEEEKKIEYDHSLNQQSKFKNIQVYEYSRSSEYNLSRPLPAYMKDRQSFDESEYRNKVKNPFLQITLFDNSQTMNVGYFKGAIMFSERKQPNENFKCLREITTSADLYLRLYILNGIHLSPCVSGGASNPYLIIKTGKTTTNVNTRDDYSSNTLNPGFYQSFEFPVKLPECSVVTIEIWHMDKTGNDTLIGSTSINIANRWYSKYWRNMNPKPVESRKLTIQTSARDQGQLKMWLELWQQQVIKDNKIPLENIAPPVPQEYELRVIVWDCERCILPAAVEDDIQLYTNLHVTCEFQSDMQQTDVHYRSQNGNGCFNWRMKFAIKFPNPEWNDDPSFDIKIWKADNSGIKNIVSKASISLQSFLQYYEKYSMNKRCVMKRNHNDKIWFDFNELNGKCEGKIKMSFEILPMSIVEMFPAGVGRDEPNNNPPLPKPEGRPKQIQFKGITTITTYDDILKQIVKCSKQDHVHLLQQYEYWTARRIRDKDCLSDYEGKDDGIENYVHKVWFPLDDSIENYDELVECILNAITFQLDPGSFSELMSIYIQEWSIHNREISREKYNYPSRLQLIQLLTGFIHSSKNPISCGIQTAKWINEFVKHVPNIHDEIIDLSKLCQDYVIQKLNDVHSNRLNIIRLESNNGLNIAIQSELKSLLSHENVQILRYL